MNIRRAINNVAVRKSFRSVTRQEFARYPDVRLDRTLTRPAIERPPWVKLWLMSVMGRSQSWPEWHTATRGPTSRSTPSIEARSYLEGMIYRLDTNG